MLDFCDTLLNKILVMPLYTIHNKIETNQAGIVFNKYCDDHNIIISIKIYEY